MRTGLRPPRAGLFRRDQSRRDRSRRDQSGCNGSRCNRPARGGDGPGRTGRAPLGGAGLTRATTCLQAPPRLLCALLLLGTSLPGLAHKVVASAWAEGDAIVGEVGFSNGDMAAAGTKVEIFGPGGAKLGEVFTDADGLFRFVPQRPVAHRFEVNLGAGHLAEALLVEDELPVTLLRRAQTASPGYPGGETGGVPESAAGVEVSSEGLSPGVSPGLSEVELESLIARAVQRELRPLRRELLAYQEKNDLQRILGGIGYICGIFGLLFFIVAQRRLRAGSSRQQGTAGS